MAQRFYIETYGCQMNEYDSEFIETVLSKADFERAESLADADIVLLNTCAIRDKAETRVIGRIGELMPLKDRKPVVFAVAGCMAQRMGRELLRKSPAIDIVLGPDTYHRLPEHLRAHADFGTRVVDVSTNEDPAYYPKIAGRSGALRGFVSATIGCDKYCTFCVVPYTRGRERPKPLGHILEETAALVAQGTRDITLLGQNVNSYRWNDVDFASLLRHVAQVLGLWRLRFTTSHPRDMSAGIIEAMRDESAVCEYLHLPVQSGANSVLKRMARKYTRERYLETVRHARAILPALALTTDIIVGFPGETDEEFEETVSLLEEVRYDAAYVFKYSVRPGTPAEKLERRSAVDPAVRQARLMRVNEVQNRISHEKNQELVGEVLEVLVEGRTRKDAALLARTRTNKTVLLRGDTDLIGRLLEVRVVSAHGLTLRGEIVRDVTPPAIIPVALAV
jgi:tRNA-2-methylthio-N6-dimethylallyladenosine synthase